MKSLNQFVRMTLAGGVLFLVPIAVLVIIIGKALSVAHKLIDPLILRLPDQTILGVHLPVIAASVVLILFCFFAGLLARTALAKKAIGWLESTILSNLPGYEFFKDLGEQLLGMEKQAANQVVLVRIEDAWQFAFLLERLDHGHVTVFVPGSPNPQAGSVYFLTEGRIRPVDVPPTAALKCLRRMGAGANVLLSEALREPAPPA
jgi:uncharacterized membrane protein